MSELDIDRPKTYSSLDPDDMYRRVNDLPEQMEDAAALTSAFRLPESYRDANNVLIAGMGGSAIGGSLLESYAALDATLPIAVWRGYGLPGYIGADSLVVAVSYSGNTEETLSAFHEAHDRGAKLVAITTGGQVAQLAEQWDTPILRFSYDAQPRATLGYLLTPLVSIAGRLGWLPPQEVAINAACAAARQARIDWQATVPAAENLAKQLALACCKRAVVIYGAEYLSAVARRWKTQMNENAKNWAFWEEFSELNHNAIVGYEHPPSLLERVQVILLKGSQFSERIARRIEITEQLLQQHRVAYSVAEARTQEKLAEIISLIALGDYVSYYFALLNGVDPTTIIPINFLKEQLGRA